VGYEIVFKKRFAKNLLNVISYLELEWGEKVADEFYDKITELFDLLASHPFIGAPSVKLKNLRGVSITRHNRLFYRIEKNKVIIVALGDTRRKNYH